MPTTLCRSCGLTIEGLAAHCPRCGEPLPPPPPPASPSSPATSKADRRPMAPWLRGLCAAGAALGLFLILGYVGFVLFFCLDIDIFGDDGVNECAGKDRAAQQYLWLVQLPLSVGGGVATWWLAGRIGGRRWKHPLPPSPPKGLKPPPPS